MLAMDIAKHAFVAKPVECGQRLNAREPEGETMMSRGTFLSSRRFRRSPQRSQESERVVVRDQGGRMRHRVSTGC